MSRVVPVPTSFVRVRPGDALSNAIRRAAHSESPTVQHVGVDHRRCHVGMPQQLLDGTNVVAVLEQVCREGVAQGVAACALRDSGFGNGALDPTLNGTLMQVMPPLFATLGVPVRPARGEYPLPRQLAGPTGRLALKGIRERHTTAAAGQVAAVQPADARQLGLQEGTSCLREHGDPILVALSAAHTDFASRDVDVLHAKLQAFHES